MSEYGVTDKGFVIKRADIIMEEVHSDLTTGLGFDTRQSENSFLDVLITTFTGQIADLWEVAQENYYSKYPATATGLSLDNSVQYGGIKRSQARRSIYPLHCAGNDGTEIESGTKVATSTLPKVFLSTQEDFEISRKKCNKISVLVSVVESNIYTVSVNGTLYNYSNSNGNDESILLGLSEVLNNGGFETEVIKEKEVIMLKIADKTKYRNNNFELSSNLTACEVVTVHDFYTDEYGKKIIPLGVITEQVTNISGFNSVINILEPDYGRLAETDVELRQSYIAKSALRSNTMIDSITSELINNVKNVDSASGYENANDKTDSNGLPPHSIEIVVDGGDEYDIAKAILAKKAGGIPTHGKIAVDVNTSYGDIVRIRFNRPVYVYAWIKVVLHADKNKIALNYKEIVKKSIISNVASIAVGSTLYIQMLEGDIYRTVAGITYVDIYTASSEEKSFTPNTDDYKQRNIITSMRQKIVFDKSRIEVILDEDP